MSKEQLFASFLLDESEGLEIALQAESVAEATPINSKIQRLPASLDFVEGIMHLREEVIPIINLKKRLGLEKQHYSAEAKVAVVNLFHRRYGLLFDDIKEVFGVGKKEIHRIDTALQTEDKIISALIHREKGKRTVELLELGSLFPGNSIELEKAGKALQGVRSEAQETEYFRYVVFVYHNQHYGIPVELTQEITFCENINRGNISPEDETNSGYTSTIERIFREGDIDGTLNLRGRTIPVMTAGRLLSENKNGEPICSEEDTRILVLSNDGCYVGIVVEKVTAIETIPGNKILPVDNNEEAPLTGIFQGLDGTDIMLLNMEALVCDHIDELKAMGRLSEGAIEEDETAGKKQLIDTRHLITENCYLIFSIGKNMAIQLKDVQEIIERENVLNVPGENGYKSGVINLRGHVVPVINLRRFFNYTKGKISVAEQRLIICNTGSRTVAFEVDAIVTIFKQEKYQNTSSLHPDLAEKEDVLDRLIVFEGEGVRGEHVLVVNIHNFIRNHLDVATA